jgi:hypothetical protein
MDLDLDPEWIWIWFFHRNYPEPLFGFGKKSRILTLSLGDLRPLGDNGSKNGVMASRGVPLNHSFVPRGKNKNKLLFPMHFTSDFKAAEMTLNETIDF